jgi:hypothetical protein
LPGERLSRAADAEPAEVEAEEAADTGETGPDAIGEDGQRRRRRRGGRGRGRGRRTDEAGLPLEPAVAGAIEEDEEFDEPQPANLPHHTFGSVWDSQIGVPSSGSPAVDTLSGGEAFDDEDLEEPEVPEYLLAERRQRGGGRPVGGRPARGRAAYQVALDRERFGSRGAAQPAFGGGAPRSSGGGAPRSSGGGAPRSSGGVGRDRGRGGRPQQGGSRPVRAPRMDDRQRYDETRSSSSEPWSEVPPELEELLRAELSRKTPVASTSEPRTMAPASPSEPVAEAKVAEAKPARRTRTTKAQSAEESVAVEMAAESDVAPVKATRTRTTKAAAPKTTSTRTRKAASTDGDGEAAPKKPATRRKTAAASEPGATTAPEATEG